MEHQILDKCTSEPWTPSTDVTMTIYAHAALDEKRRALGKLGDAFG